MNGKNEAWEAYKGAVEPLIRPLAKKIAGQRIQRLMGFWVVAHSFGGRAGVLDAGMMSLRSWDRQHAEFKAVTGVYVMDFLPEVAEAIRKSEKLS
jgi:hypothetical protein